MYDGEDCTQNWQFAFTFTQFDLKVKFLSVNVWNYEEDLTWIDANIKMETQLK